MGFLKYDSPFMMGLAKVTDLIMINFYTMILCIPVVTAGAAITALHCMSLKIVRNEHSRVTKEYFHSFVRNFKQATLIWLVVLVALAILAGDCFILFFTEMQFSKVFRILFFVVAFLLAFVYAFIYPILAKFDNTIKNTLKNALLIGILQLPKTVLMVAAGLLPVVLFLIIPYFPTALSILILFGFSGPSWLCALLYNKYFQVLEDQILEQNADENAVNADDEVIFKDEEFETPEKETDKEVEQN